MGQRQPSTATSADKTYYRGSLKARRSGRDPVNGADYEHFSSHGDFARFHTEQACRHRDELLERLNGKTGEPLARSTINSRLLALRAFLIWLSDQNG